jgi:hypothetical protein
MELTIKVICKDFPGQEFFDKYDGLDHSNIHLGIQKGEEVLELVPGDSKTAEFAPTFRVAEVDGGKTNFLGPYAKGTKDQRFFYLCWGDVKLGGFHMFRRAKIQLSHLSWKQVEKAVKAGKPITVNISLTGKDGSPVCATLKPPYVEWE